MTCRAHSGPPSSQLLLPLLAGARCPGRKRGPKRNVTSGVPHRARPVHKGRHPIHVTLRIRPGLPSLRQQVVAGMIRQVIREQRAKAYGPSFQIVEHSIQSNHLHFLLEAADGPTQAAETRTKNALRSGITGFQRAFAHRLNKLLRRRGAVFCGRYHRHDLVSPREVRNALRYVLHNHAKHVAAPHPRTPANVPPLDPYSSAETFTGWKPDALYAIPTSLDALPEVRARTWLLAIGWRRHGLLDPLDTSFDRGCNPRDRAAR